MKKLVAVALLSLGAVVLGTGTASAGWLRKLCCHDCYLTIKCKQYNAFSPSAFGCVTFSPCCAPCANPGCPPAGPDCEHGFCGNGEGVGQYGGVAVLPPTTPGNPTANLPQQVVPPTTGGATGHLLPGQGRLFPAQPTGMGPNFPAYPVYPGFQGGLAPNQVPQQWDPQYWGNPQGAFPGR